MAAAKKKTGTAMAVWDAKLAELAKKQKALSDTNITGTPRISVRGGIMTFKNNKVPNSELDCIILDYAFEHSFYGVDAEFDPDNPANPVCFALTQEDERKMVPHEMAMDKQSETCAKCQWNVFGTANKGKGKACKNIARLILIPADALKTGIAEAEVAIMNVPVTSVRNWTGYVDRLNDTLHKPTLGVITRIKAEPDPKNQVLVSFMMKQNGEIDDGDAIGALIEKQASVQAVLMKPYEPQAEEAKPAKGKNKAAPAKKAGAKARR